MSHAEVLVRVSSILKEFGFCPKEKCIDNIKLYCSFCIQNHNFLYANAYLVCWLFDYFFNLFWKVSLDVQDVLLWHISQRCVFIIKVTLSEFLRTSPYCFFKWTLGHIDATKAVAQTSSLPAGSAVEKKVIAFRCYQWVFIYIRFFSFP